MTLHTKRTRAVYFIRPVGMKGPVKIGCSCSPDGRRRTLECWSPFPLEIVAEITGNMDIERQFHSLFRAQHQHREWFEWSPALQLVIDQVVAGQFDLTTLPESVPFKRVNGRDLSFLTPQWKLSRSFSARLQGLRKRGAPWASVSAAVQREFQTEGWRVSHWICDLPEEQLPLARARIERVLASLEPLARPTHRKAAA